MKIRLSNPDRALKSLCVNHSKFICFIIVDQNDFKSSLHVAISVKLQTVDLSKKE